MNITVPNTKLQKNLVSGIKNPNIKIVQIKGNKGEKGDKGEDGATYDDTELKNRVTALENTVGTLNDQLEVVLNGG